LKNFRILSLVGALGLLIAGCSSDPTNTTPANPPTQQATTVQIADTAFTPASVAVAPGSTVTWSNNDSVPHTVSFGDAGPQSSEILDPGGTFAATFAEAGTYAYFCELHPEMEGTVEVGDSEATASAAAPTETSPDNATTAAPAAVVAAGTAGIELPGTGTPGIDIAQGEWALVPSAHEARPGTITFRFRNLGTVPHSLRIRTPGSGGDRLEWRGEEVMPGEAGLLVVDLAAGTYEIDCPVEDGHGEHDQLGMEFLFTVHGGAGELAPLPGGIAIEPVESEASVTGVAISAFAFGPGELRVPVGATVTWTNEDPVPHTVTSDSFDTGILDPGSTSSATFDTAGSFDYFCAIHPEMQGRIVVDP